MSFSQDLQTGLKLRGTWKDILSDKNWVHIRHEATLSLPKYFGFEKYFHCDTNNTAYNSNSCFALLTMIAFVIQVYLLALWLTCVSACDCRIPSLKETYLKSYYDRVVFARVLATSNFARSNYYSFKVTKVFKGCKLDYFIAKSPSYIGSCGRNFRKGKLYIIPLPRLTRKMITISLCEVSLFGTLFVECSQLRLNWLCAHRFFLLADTLIYFHLYSNINYFIAIL